MDKNGKIRSGTVNNCIELVRYLMDKYEGDFRCSKCESTVPGKWEYQHNEEDDQRNWSYPSCFKAGYTGDFYCRDCGKLSRRGEKVPAIGKHTEDAGYFDLAPSTCTATGLKKHLCYVRNIVIREEILPALGHDWVKDEANSTVTITAYKCNRTYTPIRFIPEELGASVEWLEKEQKVIITKAQAEEK